MTSLEGWDRRRVLRWLTIAPAAGIGLTAGLPALAGPQRGSSRRAWLLDLARGAECRPTSADTEGPFYLPGAPRRALLAGPLEAGDRMLVRGTVLGPDCRTPLGGALVDVWQADAEGLYHGDGEEGYRLRGVILTDARGRYSFETVVPGRYKTDPAAERFRPAHIHFTVSGPGHRPLTTQLYFKGDPYLGPKDACGGGCDSHDSGRIVDLVRETDGAARFTAGFDVVLAAT